MKKSIISLTLILFQAASAFAGNASAIEILAYNLIARSSLTTTTERSSAYTQILELLNQAGLSKASQEEVRNTIKANPELRKGLQNLIKTEELSPADIPMEAFYAEG